MHPPPNDRVHYHRRIVLDFDDVLYLRKPNERGSLTIDSDPVPGMVRFCHDAREAGWMLYVMSARFGHQPRSMRLVRAWLKKWKFPRGVRLTSVKLPALIYVDDRALRFDGNADHLRVQVRTAVVRKTWKGR